MSFVGAEQRASFRKQEYESTWLQNGVRKEISIFFMRPSTRCALLFAEESIGFQISPSHC